MPDGGKLGVFCRNTYQESMLTKTINKLNEGRCVGHVFESHLPS